MTSYTQLPMASFPKNYRRLWNKAPSLPDRVTDSSCTTQLPVSGYRSRNRWRKWCSEQSPSDRRRSITVCWLPWSRYSSAFKGICWVPYKQLLKLPKLISIVFHLFHKWPTTSRRNNRSTLQRSNDWERCRKYVEFRMKLDRMLLQTRQRYTKPPTDTSRDIHTKPKAWTMETSCRRTDHYNPMNAQSTRIENSWHKVYKITKNNRVSQPSKVPDATVIRPVNYFCRYFRLEKLPAHWEVLPIRPWRREWSKSEDKEDRRAVEERSLLRHAPPVDCHILA